MAKLKVLSLITLYFLAGHFCLCAQKPEVIESIYLEKDQGLKERSISFTTRDDKGYFYFFSDNALQRYDGKNFEEVDISIMPQIGEQLSDIISVKQYKKHTWIKFRSGQYACIKNGGLQLIKKDSTNQNPTFQKQHNFNKESSLMVTLNGKIYKWGIHTLEIINNGVKKEIKIPNPSNPKFLKTDKKGNIIVAYSNRTHYIENFYVLDTSDVLHNFTKLVGVYETAKDIYTDDAFYKWMMCGYNGVKIVTLKRKGVDFIHHKPYVAKGQFGPIIMGVASCDSSVLISTERGHLLHYYPEKKTFEDLNIDYGFLSSGLGKILYDNKRGQYILKGHEEDITDLYFVDPISHNTSHHQIEEKYNDFLLTDNGHLLLVGQTINGQGIILDYNLDNREKNYIGIRLPPIRTIFFNEESKNYYIGTQEGLYICDKHFKIISKLAQDQDGDRYFYHQDIAYTYYFADHIIACSRGGGVYIIDPQKHVVDKHLTFQNGLSDPVAISAVADNENRLWVATFNGLNVIDSSFNIIKTIYEFDGLPSREFNSLAVSSHKGSLYFGSINGAIRIDPNEVVLWESSHNIALENIEVFNNNRRTEITIDSSYVELEGADSLAINYNITDYYKYPYNLQMLDVTASQDDIKINQGKKTIGLSNIKSGLTSLQLKLESISNIQSLDLDIQTDFSLWKNLILLLITIVSLSTLIIYFSTNYIKKQEQLKTDQNKKISELQLSALQGQMNPHFIFNALGAIQYFIQTNDVTKADGYLSDFALLMRGILDSSSKKFITLKEEVKLLKLYVGLEKARFENKFDINFTINEHIDEETLIPPMIIQPYVENAVNHGLHHLKGRKGVLDINIDYEDDLVTILIEDNGIGREAAQKLRDKPRHESRAMGITKERVLTINNSSEVQVSIELIDLKDSKGQAKGTRVLIKIKD